MRYKAVENCPTQLQHHCQPQHHCSNQPQHHCPTQPQHHCPTQPQHHCPTQPQHGFHVPQECFVDTHTTGGSFTLQHDDPERTIFEDHTCNHNKTLLELTSLAGPDHLPIPPIQITIRTRGCDRPIRDVILPESAKVFQVEDFESLVVQSVGTEGTAEIKFNIEKTFCICCVDDDKKTFYSYDQKLNLGNNHNQKGKCFIAKHGFSVDYFGSSTQTIFEDYTCNHNKTLLDFTINQPVSVTIRKRGCHIPLTLKLDPGVRSVQVEDLQSVSVSRTGDLLGDPSPALILRGQKTFCICCSGEDNDQKYDPCCGKCNFCDCKERCVCSCNCSKCRPQKCCCPKTNFIPGPGHLDRLEYN
ncbi:hypothetical protein [Lysinibacillus xylanilyticus]|uniref:hypothetical protein n=1 Tax=Lysinibacillus xylanilyticus TaxID=582475 RepID=UPI00382E65F3